MIDTNKNNNNNNNNNNKNNNNNNKDNNNNKEVKLCIIFGYYIAAKRKENKVGRIQLPNGEEICKAGVGGYKHLGVLELDKIMCDEMKRKVKEVYQKRVKQPIKTYLNGKNVVQQK